MDKQMSETLVRTGPGTAMGDLMRRYWVPALLVSEIPEPDCPPVRVQLLGEKLQLWDETRFTVLFVTHSIPEAIRCGSRILILSPHPGQVRAELPSLARGDDDPERFKALEAEIHNMLFDRAVEETHAD